jgi:predicted RNase H-like nuclease (RuvC/YqgF family)
MDIFNKESALGKEVERYRALNANTDHEVENMRRKVDKLRSKLFELQAKEKDPAFVRSYREMVFSNVRRKFELEQMEMLQMAEIAREAGPADEVGLDRMTYEEILELQEKVGHVSKGLNEPELARMRTRRW